MTPTVHSGLGNSKRPLHWDRHVYVHPRLGTHRSGHSHHRNSKLQDIPNIKAQPGNSELNTRKKDNANLVSQFFVHQPYKGILIRTNSHTHRIRPSARFLRNTSYPGLRWLQPIMQCLRRVSSRLTMKSGE